MQVVIDIDDNLYTRLFDNGVDNYDDAVDMAKAIRKGTPLPKRHGRLIDADKTALLSDLFCYTKYTGIDEAPYEDATKALEFAPTVVEADGGDAE